MTKPVPSAVRAYMASIGRKGGKNGKGKPKKRRPKKVSNART